MKTLKSNLREILFFVVIAGLSFVAGIEYQKNKIIFSLPQEPPQTVDVVIQSAEPLFCTTEYRVKIINRPYIYIWRSHKPYYPGDTIQMELEK